MHFVFGVILLDVAFTFLSHETRKTKHSISQANFAVRNPQFSVRFTLSVGKWNYFLIGRAKAVYHILYSLFSYFRCGSSLLNYIFDVAIYFLFGKGVKSIPLVGIEVFSKKREY